MTRTCRNPRYFISAIFAILLIAGVQAQVVLPIVPTASANVPTQPLTVDEAVAFALQHNPAITLGVENVAIAREQVNSAQAGGQPTVGITGSANYVPEGITIGGDTSYFFASAQATASQPIWPPSRWRAPVQSARAIVGINEENLRRTRQQVAFQTRQVFYQLLGAQEVLAVATTTRGVAQTQLNVATATYEAGTAPLLDVRQAEATFQDAVVGVSRAQNGVNIARAGLATQLGLPAGTPVEVVQPVTLPVAPVEEDSLVALGLTSRPELTQLNYRRQQLRAAIDLARLQSQPLVNLQAQYNQTILGGSTQGPDGFGISAVASFNLFNGGKTQADVATARLQLNQVDTLAQQISLGVTLDIRQAWLNLQNALEQLTAAEKQLTAAREAERIAELRYREGEGILLEWQQATLRYTQAGNSLAQARYQAWVAAAQLEFAVGAPLTLPTTPLTTTLEPAAPQTSP